MDNAKHGQCEKKSKISKSKAERGEREGEGRSKDASTLASFTEQATLTHREGDYSEGKAG